ncbi:anhydro-N-acetylmuramic acid kinase [Halospina denitrificans]|uniref:Anhydro-N-acetylmuramic acid kinase n=1 Tax=Halospina denitrificans TaxID=332522 RepID=A0A4R7K3F0_9GAMM|nr:anhydro-N-acetylmuramic acid kinase [Halospina denitrificans]TDT44617.1 anhydro-N-acetylmuramic acid kinase [Halospina denitrificans]
MAETSDPAYFIGLMSGTSMDGIDAVLVSFGEDARMQVLGHHSLTHSTPLKRRLEALASNRGCPAELGEVDALLGDSFAQCALSLLRDVDLAPARITAIGSHGQTIFHRASPSPAFSIQIGDPNRIAERTGITTVADFRRRDIAAGGQGAPLAPAFHEWYFSAPGEYRALVNLGGIANVTHLRGDGSAPLGFDTGPANRLLDLWCQEHTGADYDSNGEWAAGGHTLPALLDAMLADPYFSLTGPRSTGREYFNRDWLEHYLAAYGSADPRDVQRTLAALTAETVKRGILAEQSPDSVFICGGGAFNPVLVREISERLAPARVETTQALGLHPQRVEGAAFAWLARQRLLGMAGNLATVTGADGPRVLGAVYPGGLGGSDTE